jgi:hypothetical protein
MDKKQALDALRDRAFNAGLADYKLCELAGIRPSTMVNWKRKPDTISARVFKRAMDAMAEYEKGQVS